MADYADLGLSAFDFAVDRYHDHIYDFAIKVPDHVRHIPTHLHRRRKRRPDGQVEEVIEVEEGHDVQEVPAKDLPPPPLNEAIRNSQSRNSRQPSNQLQSHKGRPRAVEYDMSGYGSEAGYSRHGRSGRGVDNDTYEPDQYGMRNMAARDGYTPGNGYGNFDGRSSYQPQYAPAAAGYAGSAYDAEEGRPWQQQQQQRYIDYDRRAGGRYDDPRSRSHDDIARSRYDDDDDDDDDYDERSGRGSGRHRRGKSHDRDRSRSRSRGRRGGSSDDEDDDGDGNTELKKWGATIAGAAIGAYGGHRAKKDNWVPAAIGAVVGGLVAREAEKEIVKRRHDKKTEEGYRSKSR